MSETNESKSQYVINDLDVRIQRKNDSIGFQTTSQLQLRIDHVNKLNEGYKPAIEGLDAKIVSIGQSINQLKDEIITLITDAVGVSTVNTCGIASTGPSGVCTSWSGGISTCLVGYVTEYYDTVNAHIWPLSSTSNNPFSPKSYSRLTNASNEYTAGIGTFIVHVQNDSGYSAGARVSLGSSSTCVATQTEIDRKDGEITTLRTELADYISKVNVIRTDRVANQLEEWGNYRAMTEEQNEKTRLENVKAVYTDPKYSNLFLK
jgi:hypothetical protein